MGRKINKQENEENEAASHSPDLRQGHYLCDIPAKNDEQDSNYEKMIKHIKIKGYVQNC